MEKNNWINIWLITYKLASKTSTWVEGQLTGVGKLFIKKNGWRCHFALP